MDMIALRQYQREMGLLNTDDSFVMPTEAADLTVVYGMAADGDDYVLAHPDGRVYRFPPSYAEAMLRWIGRGQYTALDISEIDKVKQPNWQLLFPARI